MIYVDWGILVLFFIVAGYCGLKSLRIGEKESILWLAATFVFLNEAIDIGNEIINHYKEQPVVKEVRI